MRYETRCAKIKLKPNSVERVREWAKTLNKTRRDEALATLRDETVMVEAFFLDSSDRPDTLSPQAEKLINDLRLALQSAKSEAEAQALRREYLSKLPARDVVARRLFAGRDVEGASLVTLSDPDGKPRLQLKVDSLGKASITFWDPSGRVVRTIKP
ncbi:MAG TPA: DUF6176 family protein [Pyrinomonadaceae bacterium]|nr:DUF6176 family protein [Pyrinomonadaceae bacterium]